MSASITAVCRRHVGHSSASLPASNLRPALRAAGTACSSLPMWRFLLSPVDPCPPERRRSGPRSARADPRPAASSGSSLQANTRRRQVRGSAIIPSPALRPLSGWTCTRAGRRKHGDRSYPRGIIELSAPAQGQGTQPGDRARHPAEAGGGRPRVVVPAQHRGTRRPQGPRARTWRCPPRPGPPWRPTSSRSGRSRAGASGSTRTTTAPAARSGRASRRCGWSACNVAVSVRDHEDGGATLRLGPLAHKAAWLAIEAFLGRPIDDE